MKASESPYRTIKWVPTGYQKLDRILGSGVPLRKITEISGRYSVGKSTLALSIVESAQREKLECLWVDSEFSFDEGYAAQLGVDNDALYLVQERFAEDALDAIEEWVDKHKNALVVLDSIGGLLPRQEAEKGNGEKVIGGQAKLIASFCRKIVPMLAIKNVALVVLNHEFTDLMSGRLKTSGGEKLGYHKSIWLRLTQASKRVMQGDEQVGEIIQAEIRKNKMADTMKQSCELTMLFGKGFSKEADLFQELLEKGEITKQGNTYYRGETKLGVGLNKAREALKNVS